MLTNEPFLDRVFGSVLVEANYCNPNGDPDSGNRPRTDPISGHGLITPVCIKRRQRDFAEEHLGATLYHRRGAILREQRKEAFQAKELQTLRQGDKPSYDQLREAQLSITEFYLDARFFGGVFDLEAAKAANATGPVCIDWAVSIAPVEVLDVTITRQTREVEEEAKDNKTMGTMYVVRHGLYRFHFEVMPFLARRTGFSEGDFGLFKQMLLGAFEQDRASNRKLDLRRVEVFRHVSQNGEPCLGHVPSPNLRDRLKVRVRDGVDSPSSYDDYDVSLNLDGLDPNKVQHETWV